MYVAAGTVFEAVYESAITGLVGTIAVSIIDNQNNVVYGPTSAGISEEVIAAVPTGIYEADLNAPATPGQYTIVWSFDGSFDPKTVSVEDLNVSLIGGPLPPIGVTAGGPTYGPCSLWANVDRVAACCDVAPTTDPFPLIGSLADAATAASQFLWAASGRRFSGACIRTARPCGQPCRCGFQVLSRGHLIGWDGGCWGPEPCGCKALSQVSLSGYPVTAINEVKIDGDVIDPSEYRLDEWRYLTRLNGAKWPDCQALDLDDDQSGTFSVTYSYGQNPPELAQQAAIQLACETWKQCGGLECALPKNATRVSRQGITYETRSFQRNGNAWQTGLIAVDEFLSSVNPSGLIRGPTIWSPNSRERFARPV